ncbi:cystathionine beta-lyase [Maridesulfovibrio hydrothermalis]|uniref:Putative cystathionine beta-lyase n=1 Tax=Maridesulfovibrio hydrothermalis AM13 = DSM 14728 TaxID=1121451 RepID=L0R857_9BACT|nr:cystathionine beta-lyase [Maridesulfovibrio hydrothermalis]CCO22385.1 putative cystathionine beta-lyase [Maridesulfovibrio hydrothermalis AM13 = DSM 14728]
MHKNTRLVNAGAKEALQSIKTINPPLHRASTVLFDSYEDMLKANRGEFSGINYGTSGLAAQKAFEAAMVELEGAHGCKALQSGISAIAMVLMAFTRQGDHILICDNVYGPTRHFCTGFLTKYGVKTDFLPSSAGADIAGFIQENTRLIFMESPGSNTFEIQDVPAIAEVCRDKGIVSVMDNTWATPLYFNPFEHGVDVSIQSATKYITGHSDILLGTVSTNEKCWDAFKQCCGLFEAFAAQEDCYQALRGLRTLAVRLKHHEQAALDVAGWLEGHEMVESVIHPAFESHPEHELWKRDFKGSSGLFGFTLKEGFEDIDHAPFVDSLELFGLGYSWGGYKSLITGGKFRRSNHFGYEGKTIFRLNIGMEDVEDLKKDLAQGLERLKN